MSPHLTKWQYSVPWQVSRYGKNCTHCLRLLIMQIMRKVEKFMKVFLLPIYKLFHKHHYSTSPPALLMTSPTSFMLVVYQQYSAIRRFFTLLPYGRRYQSTHASRNHHQQTSLRQSGRSTHCISSNTHMEAQTLLAVLTATTFYLILL